VTSFPQNNLIREVTKLPMRCVVFNNGSFSPMLPWCC